MSYSPGGCKESDTIEHAHTHARACTHTHTHTHIAVKEICPEEGSGVDGTARKMGALSCKGGCLTTCLLGSG